MAYPVNLQQVVLESTSMELYVPDAAAVKEAYENGRIAFPFWSQVWPAAKAMAKFLLTNEDLTKEKDVLELGAGLGLPSLVAARNARQVHCTDQAPQAVELARKSAAHHGYAHFSTGVLNWQAVPEDVSAEVVLLSDINYQPENFPVQERLIHRFLQKNSTVVLSTPQRLVAKDFVASLLDACTEKEDFLVEHRGEPVMTTVLLLRA